MTAYTWFAYAGPYRWFAELEIGWFGGYHPLLSGAMTALLLTVVPVALLHVLLVRLRVIKSFDAGKLGGARAPGEVAQRSRGTLAYVVAGIVCCVLLGAGVIELWDGRGGDDHQTLAVENVGAHELKARWVTLTGRLATEAAFSYIEESHSNVEHQYVPLVPTSWTLSDPVSVVVEYRRYGSGDEPHAVGVARITGTLHNSGVPGFLRDRANVRLAPQHYVLVPGQVPKQTRALGFSLIGLGVLLGGLIAGVTALCYRIRRVGS